MSKRSKRILDLVNSKKQDFIYQPKSTGDCENLPTTLAHGKYLLC